MNNLLISEYVHYAAEHGKFSLQGDSEFANAAYDHLQQCFVAIIKGGEVNCLFGLYQHEDPWVQSWAAAHTLEYDENRATTKLEQLVAANLPHTSPGAMCTLQEWKRGELRFLP